MRRSCATSPITSGTRREFFFGSKRLFRSPILLRRASSLFVSPMSTSFSRLAAALMLSMVSWRYFRSGSVILRKGFPTSFIDPALIVFAWIPIFFIRSSTTVCCITTPMEPVIVDGFA